MKKRMMTFEVFNKETTVKKKKKKRKGVGHQSNLKMLLSLKCYCTCYHER